MKQSILFNTEMVRAIQEGRKTQTRRPIKPHPEKCSFCDDIGLYPEHDYDCDGSCCNCPIPVQCEFCYTNENSLFNVKNKSPYQVGQKIYVRETWQEIKGHGYIHKASWTDGPIKSGWKPSIHMPKEAARIWLEITDIRVERVQDISDVDSQKEGIYPCVDCIGNEMPMYVAFAKLWDSIYKKRGYGWELNPWVWVIEFKRITK